VVLWLDGREIALWWMLLLSTFNLCIYEFKLFFLTQGR
jgi:hypothetical protein